MSTCAECAYSWLMVCCAGHSFSSRHAKGAEDCPDYSSGSGTARVPRGEDYWSIRANNRDNTLGDFPLIGFRPISNEYIMHFEWLEWEQEGKVLTMKIVIGGVWPEYRRKILVNLGVVYSFLGIVSIHTDYEYGEVINYVKVVLHKEELMVTDDLRLLMVESMKINGEE